jgi:tetratricopeptide (TPR) repeat protein
MNSASHDRRGRCARPVRIVRQAHALALIAAAAIAALSALAASRGTLDGAPYPFVWRDVAVVYLLSALPLAASLAAACQMAYFTRRESHADAFWPPIALVALEIAVLAAVPRLYIEARCQNEAAIIAGLVEQSRFGEAHARLHRLLRLNPRATWKGRPLAPETAEFDRAVAQLTARVKSPLDERATSDERLLRARDLALLGRTSDAIVVLESSPALAGDPAAHNLRATIHETRSQWRQALAWYSRGKQSWQSRPSSPERTAGLTQAIAGVAYCRRKLGQLPEAEAAYLEMLSLAPTAQSHFLLAQFYDDAQVTTKARMHADKAIALDPGRFQHAGGQLLDRLATSHFGCLGARSSPAIP